MKFRLPLRLMSSRRDGGANVQEVTACPITPIVPSTTKKLQTDDSGFLSHIDSPSVVASPKRGSITNVIEPDR
jgi:hypothetical protein